MRATLAYTAARILLFVVVLGLLYLVISGIISFIVLSRQRDAMSGAISSRISHVRGRLDEGSRSEDED